MGQNDLQVNGLLPLLLEGHSTSPIILLDLEIKVHDEIKDFFLVVIP